MELVLELLVDERSPDGVGRFRSHCVRFFLFLCFEVSRLTISRSQ
jgi:hypothetical protein